ncbi:MAG: hypothetical protein Pars2KO_27750 [Parasphingorhabdus sp.]
MTPPVGKQTIVSPVIASAGSGTQLEVACALAELAMEMESTVADAVVNKAPATFNAAGNVPFAV